MLQISPAVTVNGIPGAFKGQTNNYILFPDSEKTNIYYAMAEQPIFLADHEGNPCFNLSWYFGSGVKSGGICTMTVALPAPDSDDPQVRDHVARALNDDHHISEIAAKTLRLCKAMDAGNADEVASLKKDLGFSDELARSRKNGYDPERGAEQFLPNADSLKIHPIAFSAGKVVLRAFADQAAYQAQRPDFSGTFETTPSQFNSNAAVLTCNLSELGANLFWHGMGGPEFDAGHRLPAGFDKVHGGSSVISVAYEVSFEGMLPAAEATVELKREVMARLNIEEQVRHGSWGRTYREDVVRGKEFNDLFNQSTNLVIPSSLQTQGDNSVQEVLTHWATKQLEDMVKVQMPGVSLADLSLDQARQIKTVQEQVRVFKLSQAMVLTKRPQAQLPKIDGLVEAQALPKLFQLIDLNDVPHFSVDLTVRPPSLGYLRQRLVERFVVTEISYADQHLLGADGKPVSALEYATADDKQPQSRTLSGTFGRGIQDKAMRYGYLVAYNDGTPPMRVLNKEQTDRNYLDLGGLDLGVLSVSLDGIDLPWDVISGARVQLRYGSWDKTVMLRKGEPPALIAKPFGQVIDQALQYQLTLQLTTGEPVVGDWVRVQPERGDAAITLRSPLGNMVNPVCFMLGDGVERAQLRLEYQFRGSQSQRVFRQIVQLDRSRGAAQVVCSLPMQSGMSSALRVVKAQVTTAAGTKELADLRGGDLSSLDMQVSITVNEDCLSSF